MIECTSFLGTHNHSIIYNHILAPVSPFSAWQCFLTGRQIRIGLSWKHIRNIWLRVAKVCVVVELQTFLQEILHVSKQGEQMTALDDTHTAQIEYVNFLVDFLPTLCFDSMNRFIVPLLREQFDAWVRVKFRLTRGQSNGNACPFGRALYSLALSNNKSIWIRPNTKHSLEHLSFQLLVGISTTW